MTYEEIRKSSEHRIEQELGAGSGPQGTTRNAADSASVPQERTVSGTTTVRDLKSDKSYRVTFRKGEVERVEEIQA